jgi:hypothetical protein
MKNFYKAIYGKIINMFQKFSLTKILENKIKTIIIGVASLAVIAGVVVGILSLNKDEVIIPKSPIINVIVSGPNVSIGETDNLNQISVSFINMGSPLTIKNATQQNIDNYVKVSPKIDGSWAWESEDYLVFQAAEEFSAGTKYKVEFSEDFFVENVEFDENSGSFESDMFLCYLTTPEFYISPVNLKETRVLAEANCNYPVDIENLSDNFMLELNKKNIFLETSYSNNRKVLNIKSGIIKIDSKEHYATLSLAKTIKNINGDSMSEAESSQVKIPSISTIFKIENVFTQIVRKKDGVQTPEQIIGIESSLPIDIEILEKNLKVYSLPDCKKTKGKWCKWSKSNINEKLLSQSKLLKLKQISSAKEYATINSFVYDVPRGNTQMYIVIGSELKIKEGYSIGKKHEYVMNVAKYPKDLKIMGDGSILNLKGDKKLSFYSRGIKDVEIKVKVLIGGQINHLISQSNGSLKEVNFRNYNFSADNITESFGEMRSFRDSHPKKVNYSFVDFDKYLKKTKSGIFLLEINDKNKSYGTKDKRLVVVTDLGIMVKKGVDGKSNVFVSSIRNQKPAANAKVYVLGKNGLPVMTKYTNVSGKATFPKLKGLNNEKTPVAYLVEKNEDISFLPFNSKQDLNYSSFDVGGEYSRYNSKDGLKAYVFSDRGIYRPGEEVKFGIIVKRKDLSIIQAKVPLQIEIINPQNKTVRSTIRNLGSGGLMELGYQTDYTSVVGKYKTLVYLVTDTKNGHRNKTLLGSEEFLVEAFEPDKIKIKTEILNSKAIGWNPISTVQAKVNLQNMFGLPAQNNLVKLDVNISPMKSISVQNFKNYEFNNPLLLEQNDLYNNIKRYSPEQQTDENGNTFFNVDVNDLEKGFYRLSIFAEGFDDSDSKSVTASDETLLSSYNNLIGHKEDGDLTYIKMNSVRNIDFVAVDSGLKAVKLDNLKIKIFEKKYISSLVKDKYGRYSYQTIASQELSKQEDFSIAEIGSRYAVPTKNAGDFIIQIENQNEEILSKVNFFVAGAGNLSFSLEDSNELNVKLNKSEYSNGEEIELSIQAPYKGYGLITIERDKVYSHKWFKTNTSSTVQRIQVPEEAESNAYVNISFVRSLGSKEIFTSPLSYAAIPFDIDKSKRNIEITIDSKEVVKSGEEVAIRYKTSKPSKVILFGVDEGILQVAQYKTPNPLGFFLKKGALEVKTSQILDLILPEYNIIQSISSFGGGSSAMKNALQRNLNPFKRKEFKPVVFWSGIIDADSTEKVFKYKTPYYFNGQMRIMAVAVNDFAFGTTSKDVVVRSPIILSSSAPLFVAPDDVFDVKLSVTNNIEDNDKKTDIIEVDLEVSEGLKVVGNKSTRINIKKKREKEITFKVKTLNKLGAQEITFKTRSIGENDLESNSTNYKSTMSVRPSTLYRTTLSTGVSKKPITIELKRKIYNELSEHSLAVSKNPIVLAKGLATFLEKYPHGCSEQITSQAMSYLKLVKFGDNFITSDFARSSYNMVIKKLMARQTLSGGISLWSNGTYVDDFVSIYVAHLLVEAEELYYSVPSQMKSKLVDWMETYIEKHPNSVREANLQAYAIYILTRNGKVVTPELIKLEKYVKSNLDENSSEDFGLSYIYMSATYKLLKDNRSANKLLKNYSFPQQKYTQGSYYYRNSLAEDAQYLYVMSQHFPEMLVDLKPEKIRQFVRPILEGNYNTLSTSYTILALTSFSDKEVNSLNLNVNALDKEGKALDVDTKDVYKIAISNSAKKVSIKDNSADKAHLFYSMSSAGFDTYSSLSSEDKNSSKVQVSKVYTNERGNNADEITVGDEIEVKVKIRTFNINITNGVIIDLLPGGFEVVDGSLVHDGISMNETREDRNNFYTSISEGSEKEIIYKIKAINSGEFIIPITFVYDMYDNTLNGRSEFGKKIVVKPRI